jgi:hypothetical protein
MNQAAGAAALPPRRRTHQVPVSDELRSARWRQRRRSSLRLQVDLARSVAPSLCERKSENADFVASHGCFLGGPERSQTRSPPLRRGVGRTPGLAIFDGVTVGFLLASRCTGPARQRLCSRVRRRSERYALAAYGTQWCDESQVGVLPPQSLSSRHSTQAWLLQKGVGSLQSPLSLHWTQV